METHFHDFLTMLRVERNVSTHTMDAYKERHKSIPYVLG